MTSLEDILKEAAKKTEMKIGSAEDILEKVQAYPTGNIAVDSLTGVGGFPVGRLVELYGFQSSGKSTSGLQCASLLQKQILSGGNSDPKKGPIIRPDFVIPYFDYEYALDIDYCKALGIDTKHPSFMVIHPTCLEEGANFAKKLIDTGRVPLFIWDSVAKASPQAKLDEAVEKSLPALSARLYSVFLSTIVESMHRNNCTGLFINHAMEAISMGGPAGYGPPQITTPGGRALKYYASLRLEYKVIGSTKSKFIDPVTLEEKEQIQASNIRVKGIKNKVGAPNREVVVRVRYGKGFDNFWTALKILIDHGHIKAGAGYFYFHELPMLIHPDMERATTGMKRPFVRGEQAIFQFADARPDWREKVIKIAAHIVSKYQVPEIEDKHTEETDEGLLVDTGTGEIISENEIQKVISFIPQPIEELVPDPVKDAVMADLFSEQD